MKRSNYIFLSDIIKSIDNIERYTSGFDLEHFLKADMEQFAVVRNLEIIGEASHAIHEEFKIAHPTIPWRSIHAFRNIIVHEYFDVDMEAVWNVIIKDLPLLKTVVKEAMLNEPAPQ